MRVAVIYFHLGVRTLQAYEVDKELTEDLRGVILKLKELGLI
ncbi:MAG: hypothetical protein ACPL4K_02825 [Candidatus Margulisiibacteriota bacterium]